MSLPLNNGHCIRSLPRTFANQWGGCLLDYSLDVSNQIGNSSQSGTMVSDFQECTGGILSFFKSLKTIDCRYCPMGIFVKFLKCLTTKKSGSPGSHFPYVEKHIGFSQKVSEEPSRYLKS